MFSNKFELFFLLFSGAKFLWVAIFANSKPKFREGPTTLKSLTFFRFGYREVILRYSMTKCHRNNLAWPFIEILIASTINIAGLYLKSIFCPFKKHLSLFSFFSMKL